MSARGIVVDDLPYSVGRRSRHMMSGSSMPDLSLEDDRPFHLSRRHFAIVKSGTDIVVQDLESTLGTEVNGEPIGRHFGKDYAELKPGDNTIVAGGHDSPFVFRIHLD